MNRFKCLSVLLFGLPAFYLAAQPRAVASFQPERIETGDTTVLLIMVSGLNTPPKDPDFLAWKDLIPAENILSRGDWRKSGAQWARKYTLIAFDSAHLELPPLTVHLSAGPALATNALELMVYPTPGAEGIENMSKIRDIKRLPQSWIDYWPWLFGFSMVMLGLLWWLRKSRSRPVPIAKPAYVPAPELSPAEHALRKLNELEQKQLWKNAQTKAHLSEISFIIREFLEKKYRFPALESTTREIWQFLQPSEYPPELRPALKAILQKTDMVKYAQGEMDEKAQLELLNQARSLVSLTPIKQGFPAGSNQSPPSPAQDQHRL